MDVAGAGEGWAHFCARPTLWGVLLWGRPGRDGIAGLSRSLLSELVDPAVPHGSLVDARRIEGVDAAAFETLTAYVDEHRDALAKQVQRLALIRPLGMEGAVVAGFFEVLPKPYPVATFESPDEALSWLEHDASIGPELDALYAELAATPAIVSALRAVLADYPPIADAAKRLGMSERTLQRRLRDADTSYQDEVNQARIRAARRLLLDTDTPITTIALEVGCSSPQHFSALFRRLVGQTPSDFRLGGGSGA